MPSASESMVRASISVLQPKTGGGASELDHIEFPFNPKEWAVTHTAEWKTETTKKSVAPPEFKGPKPSSASVEIFLDESDKDGGDISKTVKRLKTLVAPDPSSVSGNKPSAPHVLFE